jgi:branched-chain amino acid transport system substrate-binding protein
LLGWVGTTSGVLGALLADQAPGVRAWVADANASGRLGNRKVRVIYKDDGGDPGKSAAFVREFVEKDNVVAMFAPQTVLTGQAWMGYLGEKGVPLLGSDGGNPVTDHSTVTFQPMAGADVGSPASMVTTFMAVQPGKTKIALLYCRELNTCLNSGRVVNDYSKKVGINVVYTGENSLAAPDYTADVLAAKNAGAEAVLTYYDHQSTIRIKQAMDRQGWHVPIIGPKSLAISEFLRLGGASVDGIYTSATSQPFCCSPVTSDYMQAMQRYAPDSPYGDFGAGAWLTGKMLEQAAALVPGPLTRQSLMDALYTFEGETLGGRVPPLTFPKSSADRQAVNACTVPLQVKGGKFVAPVGLTFRCATVPPTTIEPAK